MKKNLVFIGITSLVAVLGFVFISNYYKSTEVKTAAPQISNQELIKPHSPTLGPVDAKVTLVEFLDPECEACRAVDSYVKGLVKEQFAGKVHYVVRYAPFHPNSGLAVALLEEAKAQGKYWEALSTLFFRQPEWGDHHAPKPHLIRTYLTDMSIKLSGTDDEIMAKHKTLIEENIADAKKWGIKATPTFFVNGNKLDNISYDAIKTAIESELQK